MEEKIIKLLIKLKKENKQREEFLKRNMSDASLMQTRISITVQKESCKSFITELENLF
jgi:hypothetical protein